MIFLKGAQISISHAVSLAPDDIVNWDDIATLVDCQYLSSDPETVQRVSVIQLLP